jgi:hypothetical protein
VRGMETARTGGGAAAATGTLSATTAAATARRRTARPPRLVGRFRHIYGGFAVLCQRAALLADDIVRSDTPPDDVGLATARNSAFCSALSAG